MRFRAFDKLPVVVLNLKKHKANQLGFKVVAQLKMSPGIYQPINASLSDKSCVLIFSTFICLRGGGRECWKWERFLDLYLLLCQVQKTSISSLLLLYCGPWCHCEIWFFCYLCLHRDPDPLSVYIISQPKRRKRWNQGYYHGWTWHPLYKILFCISRISSKYVEIIQWEKLFIAAPASTALPISSTSCEKCCQG